MLAAVKSPCKKDIFVCPANSHSRDILAHNTLADNGGMNKGKAVLITALSGVPTMLGALLGYMIGELGAIGLAISLGFASGAMLYVVFGEILPQSILMYHSKLPAFTAIGGILAGLLIIFG